MTFVAPTGEAQLAARPAELVHHRLEGEPDREARAAAHEEQQKADCDDRSDGDAYCIVGLLRYGGSRWTSAITSSVSMQG